MPRYLTALALLLLLPTTAEAQRRFQDRGESFAEKGDAALTFSIDGLFLAPTEGGVGARLWVADRTVLGASLGFGYSRDSGRYGSDVEAFRTRVSFALEQHVGSGRRVSPFIGGRVQFGYAAYEGGGGIVVYEDTPTDGPICDTRECPVPEPCDFEPCPDPYPYPLPTPDYGSSVTEVSIGGGLLLGAEVKLIDRVSLAAAHTIGMTYTRGDGGYGGVYYDDDGGGTPPPRCEGCEGTDVGPGYGFGGDDYDRFDIGTGTTSLTLSIYF